MYFALSVARTMSGMRGMLARFGAWSKGAVPRDRIDRESRLTL
jgi:hypothetical protein